MEKKTRSIVTNIGLKIGKIEDFLSVRLKLQELWLKRLNAVAIDYFIILLATGIVLPNSHFTEFVLASGILSLVYFSVMEAYFGYTLGKKIFSLKVTMSNNRKPILKTSIIRNISKLNIILLVIDTVVGLTSKHKQKYADKLTKTTVIDASAAQEKPISEVIYCEETVKVS